MVLHRSVSRALCATLVVPAACAILVTQCRRDYWNRPEIFGVVRDFDSHDPIESALVVATGPGYQPFIAYTGANGAFYIPPATFRRWQHRQVYPTKLRIQKSGYYTENAETWHGYGEGSTKYPAPRRRLDLLLESAVDSSVDSDRPIHFFR